MLRGTDVNADARQKGEELSQPYLMILGETSEEQDMQYFVVADRSTIPAGDTMSEAMDRLFKIFYIFNVEFPKALTTFYNFLALLQEVVQDVKPLVRTRYSQIRQAMGNKNNNEGM